MSKKVTPKKVTPKKVNNNPGTTTAASKPSYEEKLRAQRGRKRELTAIAERAIREWPSMKQFNQALRYLEVFAQLMKLKPFLKWMIANIEVHDQIDHKRKAIDTIVVYKGPEDLGSKMKLDELGEQPEGPEVVYDLDQAEQPLCPPTPERSPDQNIVRCPHCKLLFDANVDAPRIELATDIPADLKK